VDDILLIDDDVELCSMLTEYMGRNGFRVTQVHRGDTGLKAALEKPYALVLLDVMLPGLDGFEVLRRIRASSAVSVLLLTARGDDVDRIVGLEIGADVYPSLLTRGNCWRGCARFCAGRVGPNWFRNRLCCAPRGWN
jgi:two-component system response regulator CpxR